jgi:predicted TIM-barrel fold metal-dependent hydrolase
MRIITVEEHFISPSFGSGPGKLFMENFGKASARNAKIANQLSELGDQRIAEMDAAGIDIQVLSLNYPGVEQAETSEAIHVAQESNDFLAEAVKRHPTRFAALATVATSAPDEAAKELDLRVRQQNFKGAIVNGHTRGRYLDDKFFSPFLECAESLDVPIYLHPTVPPKAVVEASYGGLPPHLTTMLSSWAWGWHIETANHLLRMIVGGVFDRFPKLQIVIGHLGEGIPFMLPRLDRNLPMSATKLHRPVGAYLRENVHYTFGGFNFPATFLNLLLEIGVDRIMFSVDYPYGSMEESRTFLENLPLPPADRERIAHQNAGRLFNV